MTPDDSSAEFSGGVVQRVAVIGSGAGTTARALIEGGSRKGSAYRVELIISTSAKAGINIVASDNAVTLFILDRSLSPLELTERLLVELRRRNIDIVALAGFMRLLPETVIEAMGGHVLNVHPALLPRHGGVGMFGRRVHESVLESGDVQTGATVHLVNARYDEGRILGQTTLDINAGETVEELEQRVKVAERLLYPVVLDSYAADLSFHVGKW